MTTSVFRDGLYKNKSVFVTGGSSGINLSIAKMFGELGARVAINGRNQEKLDGAVTMLKGAGIDAYGFSADVRKYEAVETALKTWREKAGEIDVLVCGAAGNFPAAAIGMSANAFKAVIDIDLLGTFNACRAGYEFLKKPGAVVINISAPQAFVPMAFQAHVCAAKAGVDMLTRTLALEWGAEGVRVVSISPGPIEETEGMDRLAPAGPAREKLKTVLPIPRMGKKDDVARMAAFLASDAASYCTGAVYTVDGGQTLMGGGLLTQILTNQA